MLIIALVVFNSFQLAFARANTGFHFFKKLMIDWHDKAAVHKSGVAIVITTLMKCTSFLMNKKEEKFPLSEDCKHFIVGINLVF
jgi:hypothetical protein